MNTADDDSASVYQPVVEKHIKSELRRLADIETVNYSLEPPAWDCLIHVDILEIKYKTGQSTGDAAVCVKFLDKVPAWHFTKDWRNYRRKFPSVNLPLAYTFHHKTTIHETLDIAYNWMQNNKLPDIE